MDLFMHYLSQDKIKFIIESRIKIEKNSRNFEYYGLTYKSDKSKYMQREKVVIARMKKHVGIPAKDLAEFFGVSVSRIYVWIRQFQDYV